MTPLPASHRRYRYPWRGGNRFHLLVDGPRFFPHMLDAIREAEHFICLELYLVSSGRVARQFITALVDAARRGVRVLVLLDDYGCRGLAKADRQRLIAGGVQLALFNPFRLGNLFRNLQRDHRKLLLVDGKVGFTGGAGLTDDFQRLRQPERTWHEVMLVMRGPVLQDWLDLFARGWQQATGKSCGLPVMVPPAEPADQHGRVSLAEGIGHQEILASLVKRCRNAERRIWIATPYFVVSGKLRRALRHAARRGVDVRVLVPGPISDHPWVSHASRGYYSRLLRHGVRIFEYRPRFLHAKVQLCDGWSSIGSSNLDRWNQHWNLDANQEVEDERFAREVAVQFEKDFVYSQEILFRDWRVRPWTRRALEWSCGRIVRLLEWLSRTRQRTLAHTRKRKSS